MEIQSIIDVVDIYKKTDEEFVAWLTGKNLFVGCVEGSVLNTKKKLCNSIKYTYFCKKCRKSYSIFSKSFFENVKINVPMVILIMWYWATEVAELV